MEQQTLESVPLCLNALVPFEKSRGRVELNSALVILSLTVP